MLLGKVGRTDRGFERVEFSDFYGVECSIQQSSLATEDALWLGCNEANPRMLVPGQGWQPVPMPPGDIVSDTRMHLSVPMVKALIKHLQAWLATKKLEVK